MEKRDATDKELLAWFLFNKFDEIPYIESPEEILKWLEEFDTRNYNSLAEELSGFEEFAEKFNTKIS